MEQHFIKRFTGEFFALLFIRRSFSQVTNADSSEITPPGSLIIHAEESEVQHQILHVS